MPADPWLKLFASPNPVVRKRAAQGLLRHAESLPLPVLLEILDDLSDAGLGAAAQRVLLGRHDPDLFDEMALRLESPSPFVRGVACQVLGQIGDRRATPDLLGRLEDRCMPVRKAAAVALARLNDPESGPAMFRHYATHSEDINVCMALEGALSDLGMIVRRPMTPERESALGAMLQAGEEREVFEALSREAGLSYDESRRWISAYRSRSLREPERPCPFCGKALRTNRARQCFACGRDWHDSGTGPLA